MRRGADVLIQRGSAATHVEVKLIIRDVTSVAFFTKNEQKREPVINIHHKSVEHITLMLLFDRMKTKQNCTIKTTLNYD